MGIRSDYELREISDDEYHEIDHRVMGVIFKVHTAMCKQFNEPIFQTEIHWACEQAGFEADREVPVTASYKDFHKTYHIDMIVDHAVIYELKTVSALASVHESQLLHYLFLTGGQYGKLVNLANESVEWRYVTTHLTTEKRYQFRIHDDQWQDLDADAVWLKSLMLELINEWGCFLKVDLFYDAIYFFRGGKENVIRSLEVWKDGRHLGRQKTNALNPKTAFKITAFTEGPESYEAELRKFMSFTPVTALHWINFNHHDVTFRTLL